MRSIRYIACFLIAMSFAARAQAAEYKKLAQTGFQFLSVETDARAAAMAGAMTTVANGSGALFHNPAVMAFMPTSVDVAINYNRWIADINHYSASLAFSPANHKYGTFGFSWHYVDYGEMQGALPWANDKGYIKTETFNPSAIMVGVGYAKALSAKFSVGAQLKSVGQQLGYSAVQLGDANDSLSVRKYKQFAAAFDFGTLFKTGWKSLAFGMSVRNFSNEIQYETESFQLPLTFCMGVSMNLLDMLPAVPEMHVLSFALDAVHPRSYPEYLNIGMEYSYKNLLSLRYGYMGNRDERTSSFGFGIHISGIQFDYSYIPFGVFDETQNCTLRFDL